MLSNNITQLLARIKIKAHPSQENKQAIIEPLSYFCLKDGYKPRLEPEYFVDNNNDLVYQPEVYELAYYLAKRLGVTHIIDVGAGKDGKLQRFISEFRIIVLDYGSNATRFAHDYSDLQIIECDLNGGLPRLDQEITKNAIVIISDVLEHLRDPHRLLISLAEMSNNCPFLLISTPDRVRNRGAGDFGPPDNPSHVREWEIDEFDRLLREYGFAPYFLGYTVNTTRHQWKNTILAISGKLAQPIISTGSTSVSVLSVINVYNENDIIERVIEHLLSQGVDVRVIDNWSTDGSYEIVQEIAQANSRVSVERFPADGPSRHYEWIQLLRHVEQVASESGYDWIMHHDADEVRVSPWRNRSLRDAIAIVDGLGFNAIDFTVIDFRPTREGYSRGAILDDYFTHFEFGRRSGHFLQIKGWKNKPRQLVNISATGGHEAVFPERRVFPLKFLLKHYPLRSTSQARQKIFRDRVPRLSPAEKSLGWHTQYNTFREDSKFIWDAYNLIPFAPRVFDCDFLVERVSGVGIVRP